MPTIEPGHSSLTGLPWLCGGAVLVFAGLRGDLSSSSSAVPSTVEGPAAVEWPSAVEWPAAVEVSAAVGGADITIVGGAGLGKSNVGEILIPAPATIPPPPLHLFHRFGLGGEALSLLDGVLPGGV